ncbi:MAG: hypothetical protein Q7K03_10760 [Dehalococcoidia bacterium]|nr:hypothetical protein [Dehalococcoidia bacterium]
MNNRLPVASTPPIPSGDRPDKAGIELHSVSCQRKGQGRAALWRWPSSTASCHVEAA